MPSESRAAWRELCYEGTIRRRPSPGTSEGHESPEGSGRGFNEIFATNTIITNTWSREDMTRARGRSKVVSLKYGRANVHFEDLLDQDKPSPLYETTNPSFPDATPDTPVTVL